MMSKSWKLKVVERSEGNNQKKCADVTRTAASVGGLPTSPITFSLHNSPLPPHRHRAMVFQYLVSHRLVKDTTGSSTLLERSKKNAESKRKDKGGKHD
jgi:hypothetical protein